MPTLCAEITKGPFLQNPQKTAITIMWESDVETRAYVLYGEKLLDNKKSVKLSNVYEDTRSEKDDTVVTSYSYEARIRDLKPGTTYNYQVIMGDDKKVVKSRKSYFETVPERIEKFTFIAYGDSRTRIDIHARIASQFDRHHPAFIIHGGDYVDKGKYWQEWKEQFFDPAGPIIDHIPIWATRGNHDGRGAQFAQNFSLPGNELWYSFDYGNAHFIALDYRDHPDMLLWCQQDLADCRAEWKIAFFHIPCYNISDHGSAAWRNTFLPVFRKYGIDLVICGHSHIYERFYPLRPAGDKNAKPITHIVSGGGGATFDRQLYPHRHLAAFSADPHYMAITIHGKDLSAEVFNVDGRKIDEFSFSKKGDTYEEEYLILVKDEKPLQIETIHLLMDGRGTPQKGIPHDIKIRITSPGTAEEVRVKLKLAKRSTRSYKLDPQIVKMVLKPGAKYNLAPVKLIPAVKVERNYDWLKPEAWFEIEYESGDYRGKIEREAYYW